MTDAVVTARPIIEKQCSHGISYNEECIECQIVWYQECLQDAARRVASCTEMIKKLEREKRARDNAK